MTELTFTDELLRQLFFLTSAGLGALFATLYPLTTAVANGTYDENDDASYVMNVVMGLVSGTILGQLIEMGSVGGLGGLTRPTLALLGGFSASLVFKVLSQLVHGIESAFSDSPPRGTSTNVTETASVRAGALAAVDRQAVARALLHVEAKLPTGSREAADLRDLVDRLLREEPDR